VGATISRTAGGFSERTTVKYSDRGVWYVYIAVVQPDHGGAEGVMLPSRLCVRRLGSCAPSGDVRRWQGVQFDDF